MKPRSRMTVGIRCTAPKAWTAYVQASVSVPGQYYVASRTIAAGQALTPADLAPRDGDLVALPPGAITDPDTVAGMTAAYRITAGQPIKGAALRNAQSVVRGSNVRINAVGKGFMVSSEGQALTTPRRAPPCRCGCPAGRWSAAWSAMPGWLKCTCRQGLQECYISRCAGGPATLKFLPALSLQRHE